MCLPSFVTISRMLYMKFDTWLPRLENWDLHDTDHCPHGKCPTIDLQTSSELSYTPCFVPSASDVSVFIVKNKCALNSIIVLSSAVSNDNARYDGFISADFLCQSLTRGK